MDLRKPLPRGKGISFKDTADIREFWDFSRKVDSTILTKTSSDHKVIRWKQLGVSGISGCKDSGDLNDSIAMQVEPERDIAIQHKRDMDVSYTGTESYKTYNEGDLGGEPKELSCDPASYPFLGKWLLNP